ncbi:hypothetical protein Scep_001044 [Stephania cephalantha]|uniref:Uncharacterized protein n=1 Tax=Stephania cephalantha TaxID=152367 RepID=A0AAP0L788_9MAGN
MGGEWVVKKPSRSDEVLEAEQQLKINDEIRAHFESLAPKRIPKPNRSEPTATHDDSTTQQDMVISDHSIPELTKLRQLSSQSQSICPEKEFSGTQVEEEFIETQYYTKLNSIDKQHHTGLNVMCKRTFSMQRALRTLHELDLLLPEPSDKEFMVHEDSQSQSDDCSADIEERDEEYALARKSLKKFKTTLLDHGVGLGLETKKEARYQS